MGYSENCCQLCAVSINVARLRTKNEPKSAGWGYSGPDYYSGEATETRCTTFPEQSGCENVPHETETTESMHFPGRGCVFDGGYNGWKIGAEEMKGMNLPRYIVRRPKDTELDGEGAEYENDSDYFLTSQTTCPPDDFEPGELEHVRYGIDNFFPQNYTVVSNDDGMDVGVPVHDACWKIFERISKMRLGNVDLQGFMALWFREACGMCGFQNIKQEPVIMHCREQWWVHLPGTEYLGANPYDIPGLLLGLSEAYRSYPFGDNVFQDQKPGFMDPWPPVYRNSTDTFAKMPAELKNMILAHLSSKDIGRLRLASRSFRQLPKQLFLRLIQDELPWFWEFDELKQMDDDWWREWFKNDDPNNPQRTEEQARRIRKSREGNFTESVNWLLVYKQLCILRKSVLGVRNRARIWYVVEQVVQRISDLRERLTEQSSYNLRGRREFSVEPTLDEVDKGLVKNNIYCPRCEVFQIQREE